MARRYASKQPEDSATPDAALGALDAIDAVELRALIRDMIPRLDESMRTRFESAIIDRAARSSAGWTPAGPTEQSVSEVLAFAEAAKKVGRADPSDVDDPLQKGTNAFLAKNYPAAFKIFRALLFPMLVESKNWKAALAAHEKSAEIVTDKTYSRGDFLDGAAGSAGAGAQRPPGSPGACLARGAEHAAFAPVARVVWE